MKEIPLGGKHAAGRVAIVDDEDYDRMSKMNWYSHEGYAAASVKIIPTGKKRHQITMHRVINNTPAGLDTDHINHNGLDNRRSNLRAVTHRVNLQNQRRDNGLPVGAHVGSGSKFKPFRSAIRVGNKKIHLGSFSTAIEAHEAYMNAFNSLSKSQRHKEAVHDVD